LLDNIDLVPVVFLGPEELLASGAFADCDSLADQVKLLSLSLDFRVLCVGDVSRLGVESTSVHEVVVLLAHEGLAQSCRPELLGTEDDLNDRREQSHLLLFCQCLLVLEVILKMEL